MALWLPIGTEEALIVELWPYTFRCEHLHKTCCTLIHTLYSCALVEVLAHTLQHQLVVVFRFLCLIYLAFTLGRVEEVYIRVFHKVYFTCDGESSRLLEVCEHLRRNAEFSHLSVFWMIAYAHCSFSSRSIGFATPFCRCTSATCYNLINNKRFVASISKGEVEACSAISFVDGAEVVGSFIPCKLLCIHRHSYKSSKGYDGIYDIFFHRFCY